MLLCVLYFTYLLSVSKISTSDKIDRKLGIQAILNPANAGIEYMLPLIQW